MQSASDFAVLVGVPFVAILIAGMLRLDERLVVPHRREKKRAPGPRFSHVAEGGEVLLTDPDGRISGADQQRQPDQPSERRAASYPRWE
jgi:hypothetical protein